MHRGHTPNQGDSMQLDLTTALSPTSQKASICPGDGTLRLRIAQGTREEHQLGCQGKGADERDQRGGADASCGFRKKRRRSDSKDHVRTPKKTAIAGGLRSSGAWRRLTTQRRAGPDRSRWAHLRRHCRPPMRVRGPAPALRATGRGGLGGGLIKQLNTQLAEKGPR